MPRFLAFCRRRNESPCPSNSETSKGKPLPLIPGSALTQLRAGVGEGSSSVVLSARYKSQAVAVKVLTHCKDPILAARHEATMYRVRNVSVCVIFDYDFAYASVGNMSVLSKVHVYITTGVDMLCTMCSGQH